MLVAWVAHFAFHVGEEAEDGRSYEAGEKLGSGYCYLQSILGTIAPWQLPTGYVGVGGDQIAHGFQTISFRQERTRASAMLVFAT